jgi:hypothetical protein
MTVQGNHRTYAWIYWVEWSWTIPSDISPQTLWKLQSQTRQVVYLQTGNSSHFASVAPKESRTWRFFGVVFPMLLVHNWQTQLNQLSRFRRELIWSILAQVQGEKTSVVLVTTWIDGKIPDNKQVQSIRWIYWQPCRVVIKYNSVPRKHMSLIDRLTQWNLQLCIFFLEHIPKHASLYIRRSRREDGSIQE